MATLIQGRNLVLSYNGIPFAVATGCTLNMSTDFIETASPTDGNATQYIPTTTSWTVSTDGLVEVQAGIFAKMLAKITSGEQVTLRFIDFSTPGLVCEGKAYVESIKMTATVKNFTKYSINLKGNGALSTTVTPATEYSCTDFILPDLGDWYLSQRGIENDAHYSLTYNTLTLANRAIVETVPCNNTEANYAVIKTLNVKEQALLKQGNFSTGNVLIWMNEKKVLEPGTYGILHSMYRDTYSNQLLKIYQ